MDRGTAVSGLLGRYKDQHDVGHTQTILANRGGVGLSASTSPEVPNVMKYSINNLRKETEKNRVSLSPTKDYSPGSAGSTKKTALWRSMAFSRALYLVRMKNINDGSGINIFFKGFK